MKYFCIPVLLFASVLFFGACEPQPKIDRDALVEAEVEKKLRKYKIVHWNNCEESVLKAAKEIVDSTMLARARNIRVIDPVSRPEKPTKPLIPETKILEDTLPLKPILEDQ